VIAGAEAHLSGGGFENFVPRSVPRLDRQAPVAARHHPADDTDRGGGSWPVRQTGHMEATPQRPAATAAAVVLAGGSGTRVGAERNKVYLSLRGRPVLAWSLATFTGMAEIGAVVLVVRDADREAAEQVLAAHGAPGVEIVTGGATRQGSELAGLRRLASRIEDGAVDAVLVHDAARPLAGRPLVAAVLAAARESGGAVPGLWRDDLATAAPDGDDLAGPGPGALVAVQTPQGFRAAPLLAAYEEAARCGFAGTDTASCMQRFAPEVPIRWVPGEERNFKITYAHDLVVAEHALTPSG
jgi:2-C-methyl-D-erythritol 4-phosphate cytidylyltransferase